MQNIITKKDKQFIMDNVGKLKQVEIAKILNKSTACINQVIKGKRHSNIEIDNGIFNEAAFFKHYTY